MALDIRAFGTFRVLRDGCDLDLGGRLPAEVLALLLLAQGDTVHHEVLADQLWRGAPPASARTTLQGYVSRLRRVLEPDRGARDSVHLVTRGAGYALEIERDRVDVHRFADLASAGLRVSGPEAVALLDEALALWSGAPYAGVGDIVDAAPAVARLEELRLLAVEEHADALLDLCRGSEAVPGLVVAAAQHPLRERLQTLLARALYAGGRQVEALDVLRETTRRMDEELGLDPSPQLRSLESDILNQSVRLAAPTVVREEPVAAPGIVGRERELAALAQAWDRARKGRATAIVLTGEPGIGKTAVAEAFAASVGVAARWGRCLDTPGVPPYWPWQQVLGGLPDVSSASGAGARFAVGLELARRLRDLAEGSPQMVVLDDVQWADPDSLHALQIVLDQVVDRPVLLVLTCRSGAPDEVTAALAAASRLGVRLTLEPLDGDAVARLVAGLDRPDGVDPIEIARRSGGNPLFAAELARVGSGAGPLPDLVRDVIDLRVSGLSADARGLVELLAVVGREVSVGLVADAADSIDLDVAVREASAVGLVHEPAPGRLRSRHDVVREAVLATLGPTRRATLHRRVADALEAAPGAATSHAAIAVHRSEAAAGAADDGAARACRVAAVEALERAGDAEAAELAARGLVHAHGEEIRADLLHLRGLALRRLGRLEDSDAALRAEADIARTTGDAVRLARAALAGAGGGIGGYWSTMSAPALVDATLLEEAATHAHQLEDDLRSDVLAALAVQRASAGYDAVDLADEAQQCRATVRAAMAGYVARWTPVHAADRLDRARALQRQARGHRIAELSALHLLHSSLIENLHADEAAAIGARFSELVAQQGDGDLLMLDLWVRSNEALAQGRYERARALADEAVRAAPAASPAAADILRLSRGTVDGIIAWHERTLAGIVPDVVDLAVEPDWLTVMAIAHAQAGRRDACLATADRVLEHPSGGTRATVRAILLSDAYAELGETDRAAALLPVLESYGDTAIVFWPGMTFLGPAALYRGALKAVVGDKDAERELTNAVELCDRLGYAPFRAKSEAWLTRL